jgi:3-dehydroquinate dehydratase-2|tara:strand:- start:336 stop:770 length:435 start_codon:yes stop_codon:yes gene_type:complete
MTKILVVHGAGINMRGKVAVDIFGPETMDDYNRVIHEFADELGISVEIFHSNIQGEIVNAFYAAHDGDIDAAVINPAGFTASAPALVAAIGQVRFPTVEVHITNPTARGNNSSVSPACKGVVLGFGLEGYYLALHGAKYFAEKA